MLGCAARPGGVYEARPAEARRAQRAHGDGEIGRRGGAPAGGPAIAHLESIAPGRRALPTIDDVAHLENQVLLAVVAALAEGALDVEDPNPERLREPRDACRWGVDEVPREWLVLAPGAGAARRREVHRGKEPPQVHLGADRRGVELVDDEDVVRDALR